MTRTDRRQPVALVCFSVRETEMTFWTLAEAVEAAAMVPCRRMCTGNHRIVANVRGGRLRTLTIDAAKTLIAARLKMEGKQHD